MKLSRDTVVAFLVTPIISGVLHAIQMGNIGAGAFALLFAYPASLILGVPVMLFFAKRGWLHFWQVSLAGACLGLASAVLLFFITGLSPTQLVSDPSSPYFAVLFSVHGLAIASTFWFLTLRNHAF